MIDRCVGAFARGVRRAALAVALLAAGAAGLAAQATGKLEGTIKDQAGAAIPGAQVLIVGTTFQATADGRGYYFINNVPAGAVNVRAQFVGYKPVEVAGLRVLGGQTMTQNFQLEQRAIEVEEIQVVAAENVLVPRDEASTKQRIDAGFTNSLPVDRVANVLALVPGVVANTDGSAISIRGGRTDEAAVYIDGAPVSPGGRGGQFVGTTAGRMDVSTIGFEELSVTTGGSSAEYGNAQSGIIAVQTKAGGSIWQGHVGVENDEIGGKNHSVGYNRIEVSVSGPLSRNLTLAIGGDLEGAKSAGQGLDGQKDPVFVPAGTDTVVTLASTGDSVVVSNFAMYTGECQGCQGARLPATPRSSYRVNGKLQYTYGTGSRVAISGMRMLTNTRDFNFAMTTYPRGNFVTGVANNLVTANWTHQLSKSADRAMALDLTASYQWDRAIVGPLTVSGESSTRNPFGGFMVSPFDFMFDFGSFPIDDIWQNFRCNCNTLSPYDIKNPTQYQLVDAYRNNAYGVLGFWESGGPNGRLSMYKEDRIVGRGLFDWQVDRYNRLKLGGEYTRYHMVAYSSQLTSQAFSDAYNERPTRWSAFADNTLDLGDVVIKGGIRYDWFKSGAERPYYTDAATGEKSWFPRISSMPGYDQATQDTLFVADKSHHYVSPHVQVAFPVTERTNFRLSYAHQVQQPDFNVILGGVNTDLSVTNTNHVYGSDLDFGRTITFEFGVRHSFSDDMVLDISAYNKDKLSDAAGRLMSFYDPLKQAPVDIRVITNADFGNARGVDIRFDRRIGELFNGMVAYTFEDAKNTGSDPFTYINFGSRILNALGGGNAPPPQAALPTNTSRPHNLAGQMALNFPNNWREGTTAGSILENVGVAATFRYASGTAFTRCPSDIPEDHAVLSGQVCSKDLEGDYNGARLPAYKQFDLRLTKGFSTGRLDFTVYAEARNLFNFRNVLRVFAQTNDVVNEGRHQDVLAADLDGYAAEGSANGHLLPDGSIDLTFGGISDPRAGCGGWSTSGGRDAEPNCVYLIRAEERYGNGDHVFTLDEQTRASDAMYGVTNGISAFTGGPRRIRLGLEVNF